jgi:hypothetical protein
MLSWEQILPRRMLITGFNGSHLWNRRTPDVSEHIVRDTLFTSGGSSGTGLAEFRMRVGYLHLAIPYVGITSAPSVYRISNSPQMRPWALGTTYDRPVARRLLEEAGVPREAFGQEKMGGWLPPPESSGQSDVSEGLRTDFSDYYPKYWNTRAKILSVIVNVLIYPYRKARALNHRIAQVLGDRPLRWWLQSIASSGRAYWLTLPLGPHSLLPRWALEKMRDRYESGRSRVQERLAGRAEPPAAVGGGRVRRPEA